MSRLSRRRFLAGSAAATAGLFHAPHVQAQSDFMEPVRIRMGYAPYISAGPYYIAQAKGYFTKLSSTSCRPAMSTGRCRCRR